MEKINDGKAHLTKTVCQRMVAPRITMRRVVMI